MAGHSKIIGITEDDDDFNDDEYNNTSSQSDKTKRKEQRSTSFTYFNVETHLAAVNKSDYWKVQLGKYMKLSLSEAPYLGIQVPNHLLAQIYKKNSHDEGDHDEKKIEKNYDEDGNRTDDDDEEDEHELDEVIGYHFMACTTLFAAYVYVTSASKVFEDRLVNKELRAEFPDFEAVYHLVIDAVDTYNDDWEEAFRVQQQQIQLTASLDSASGEIAMSNNASTMEARRMMFMTEKEKKAELILRQRAELAIKKGTAELDPKLEKSIASEVLTGLETELTKLLNEEIEEKVHMNLPIARKQGMSSAAAVDELLQSPAATTSNNKASHAVHNNNAAGGGGSNGKKGSIAPDSSNSKKPSITASGNKNASNNKAAATAAAAAGGNGKGNPGTPNRNENNTNTSHTSNIVNLDDLFDLDNFSSNAALYAVDSEAGSANENGNNDEEQVASNEFAAELLYIMRLSMSLT